MEKITKSELRQMVDESVEKAFRGKRLNESDANIESLQNASNLYNEIKSLVLKNSRPFDALDAYCKGDNRKKCACLAYELSKALGTEGVGKAIFGEGTNGKLHKALQILDYIKKAGTYTNIDKRR